MLTTLQGGDERADGGPIAGDNLRPQFLPGLLATGMQIDDVRLPYGCRAGEKATVSQTLTVAPLDRNSGTTEATRRRLHCWYVNRLTAQVMAFEPLCLY